MQRVSPVAVSRIAALARSVGRVLPLAATPSVLAVVATVAVADDVLLTNGNTLEGKARREGDVYVIDTGRGEFRLPVAEVKSVTVAPTRLDLYAEKLKALDAKDAAQHIALADWCAEKKLPDLEKKHLRAVLAIDADHEAVRARLGYVRHDGKWLTHDEYMAARGFVKVGSEWLSKDEIEMRRLRDEAEKAQKEQVKTIQRALVKMSSPRRATRKEGKIALLTYAEKMGDTRLAQFATQVATFYNDSWREVKEEYERATARTDVRATVATLKRPIPSITTSLGAGTTPVTIQLPELSVMKINSTARIPITIELDEEE